MRSRRVGWRLRLGGGDLLVTEVRILTIYLYV
jgi:hypothetical protein